MNASKNTPAVEVTVSNATAIRTLNCAVCGQPVIVPTGAENVRCRLCGHTMVVRLHPDFDRYVKGLGLTDSGCQTVDIDDTVAKLFRGLSAEETIDLGATVLETIPEGFRFSKKMNKAYKDFDGDIASFFEAKYEFLNKGMQRMNVGNIVRGALKRHGEAKDIAEISKQIQ